jgi:hypothetical protein
LNDGRSAVVVSSGVFFEGRLVVVTVGSHPSHLAGGRVLGGLDLDGRSVGRGVGDAPGDEGFAAAGTAAPPRRAALGRLGFHAVAAAATGGGHPYAHRRPSSAGRPMPRKGQGGCPWPCTAVVDNTRRPWR